MAQPLTDAINALTRYANETTGASDTTLSDAVETLVEGYGQGGGYDWNAFARNAEPTGDVVLTVTIVASYGFTRMPITSLYSDTVTKIGTVAFQGCTKLKTIDLPALKQADGGANSLFQSCTSLQTANLPLLGYTQGSNFFSGCTALQSVNIPSVTRLQQSFFQNCSSLPFVDLNENCASIEANVFNGCHALKTLVMRRSTSIVTLANINAFYNSPIRGYGGETGEIYVPNDLIATYKTATNWATIFAEGHMTFEAIEGSEYE